MTRPRLPYACAAIALLAIGCPKTQAVRPDIVAPAESAAPNEAGAVLAPDAAGDAAPLVTVDAGNACPPPVVPKELTKVVCVEDYERLEGRTMGFSKDGRYFGYCISNCDPCPAQCDFSASSGPPVSLRFADYNAIARPNLSEDEIKRRMDANDRPLQRFLDDNAIPKITKVRVLHGPWRYPELVLATRSTQNESTGTSILEVGASADGGEPVFPIRIELGPHAMWRSPLPKDSVPKSASAGERAKALAEWRGQWAMRPATAAVIDVSPDGKDLGVVGFATGAMWYEDARAVRMPVDVFAKRVHAGSPPRKP